MDELTIKVCGKINPALDIVGKREDGYHLLSMILQSVNICDTISIKRTKDTEVFFRTNSESIPQDQGNIAVKAAELFCETCDLSKGYEIYLTKEIPIEGGMAGGSADAAGVLYALNEMNHRPFSEEELFDLALRLGADVPFCLKGGTMLAEGVGEELTELPLCQLKLLIVKPKEGVSTKDAYQNTDLTDLKNRPDMQQVVEAIKERDLDKLTSHMGNVLYDASKRYVPEMEVIIDTMEKNFRASKAMMSGSGSTVFGIFQNEEDRRKAYDHFSSKYEEVFLAESTEKSIYDIERSDRA